KFIGPNGKSYHSRREAIKCGVPESLTWENQASEGSAPWCEEQLFFSFSFLVSSLLPTTQPSTGGTAKAPDDKTQTALEAVHTLAVVAAVGDAKPVAASEVADTKPLDVPAEFVDKAANASSQAAPELVDTKAKASSKTKEILRRRDINFLLVSDVLDHDSQMARLLVSKVLSIVKDKDAYQWSKVTLHFLGEQHGKGPVDRLFGWTCAWIEAFLQDRPIYGLQDLLACYRAGAQEMVNTDPPRPKFHIAKFDPGVTRPETRTYFQCPNLLITRTYCLKAVATPRSIRLTNNVFSDAQGEEIGNWEIEPRTMNEDDVESKTWRRTFWSGEKSSPWLTKRIKDESDLEQLFYMIDSDKSGTVTIEEFIGPLSRYNLLHCMNMQEDLYDLFGECFDQLAGRIDEVRKRIDVQTVARATDGQKELKASQDAGSSDDDKPTTVPNLLELSLEAAMHKIEAKLDLMMERTESPTSITGFSKLRSEMSEAMESASLIPSRPRKPFLRPDPFTRMYMRREVSPRDRIE
ncbi:Voltage-dependent N-type calcium channel subunit alpha-1B, partial [Durusdinium trenchii]